MVRSTKRGRDTVRSGDIRNFFPKANAAENKPASTTGPAENKVSEKLSLSESEPAESMTSSVRPSDKALGKQKCSQAESVADTTGPSAKALGKRKRSQAETESDNEADDDIGVSNECDHLAAVVADALEVDCPDPSSQEYQLLQAMFGDMLDDLEDPDVVSKQHSEADDDLQEQSYHRRVFHRLIRDAGNFENRSKHTFPYREFLTRHSEEDLYQLLKAGTMDLVWAQCVEKRTGLSEEFLSELPDDGSTFLGEPGWYLIVLQGGPKHWVYVGQSENVGSRVADHRRNVGVPSRNQLLYHTWRTIPAVKAKVCCLGLDKCGFAYEDAQLFRNIGEMFFALMFESLQRHHLDAWLPFSRKARGGHSLNVSLPLSQGVRRRDTQCWIGKMLTSKDPELRAWAGVQYAPRWAKVSSGVKAFTKANPDKFMEVMRAVHDKMRATGYKAISTGQRKHSSFFDSETGVLRSADPSKGDLVIVKVKCADCGHERDDTTPMYVIATGEYCYRHLSCVSCAKKDPAGNAKKNAHRLIPVDDDFPRVCRGTVQNRMTRDNSLARKWQAFYRGETATAPDVKAPAALDQNSRTAAKAAVAEGGLTRKEAAAKFNLPLWRVKRDCEGFKSNRYS